MTQAGWYPDPAGQPQTFRYWNGQSWSQETTSNPYATPPGAAPESPAPPPAPPLSPPESPPTVVAGGQQQPPAPPPGQPTPPPSYGAMPPPPVPGGPGESGGYGQPPYGGAPAYPGGPTPGGSGGSGTTIAIVVIAIVLILGLGVGGFFAVLALTGDDDGDNDAGSDPTTSEATPESPETTDGSPTDSTTGSAPTNEQCFGGLPEASTDQSGEPRITGGGLSIPVPKGYQADSQYGNSFTWADDFTPIQKVIEQGEATGWVSVYGVGGLRKANGFESLEQAATVVMQCMAASPDLYSNFTGQTDLASEAITVDGAEAWSLTSELRVDDPDLTVAGDVAQVIAVDTGNEETYGLYITVVPIGDQKLIDQQADMVGKIQVE